MFSTDGHTQNRIFIVTMVRFGDENPIDCHGRAGGEAKSKQKINNDIVMCGTIIILSSH